MQNRDIPKLAYIEARVIRHPISHQAHKLSVEIIEREYNVKKGTFCDGVYDQTRILSLLYLLIVFPKEFWKIDSNHEIIKIIEENWNLNNVNIVMGCEKYQNCIYAFIHHLRNAVSHGNIEFKDGYLEFWDQNSYRANLQLPEVYIFLEKVGSLFANFRPTLKVCN